MDFIDLIVRDVAELPGRDSPEDWPEAMLVTASELRGIIEQRLAELTPNSAFSGTPSGVSAGRQG